MEHSAIKPHKTKPPRIDRSKPRDKRPWKLTAAPRKFWFE